MRRLLLAVAAAGGMLLPGCVHDVTDSSPHTAQERLADDVMNCIENSDMHPVLDKFVSERKAALLDGPNVASKHAYVAPAGKFLGIREDANLKSRDPHQHLFIAYFEHHTMSVRMQMTDDGKIVHYAINEPEP